jgi:hypothetical protein
LTFTIDGVRGVCGVNVSFADSGGRWRPKSAMYRGVDLLDRNVDLDVNPQVRDLPLVVSSQRTELSADVTDDQGAVSQEHVVLAFSTDKARWPMARYVGYTVRWANPPDATRNAVIVPPTAASPASAATASQSRAPALTNLPAGEYYVVALDDATGDDIHDPTFLDQLVPKATRVTLRDGDPQTVSLRRIKGPTTAQ